MIIYRNCWIAVESIMAKIETYYSELELDDQKSINYRLNSFYSKEPEMLKFLAFYSKHDIDLFFDIGANIGLYSVYWVNLNLKNKAFACEPAQLNYLIIKNLIVKNTKLNIEIVTEPLSSECEYVAILDQALVPGESKFQITSEQSNRTGLTTYTIDHLVTKYQVNQPFILKIDVDGKDFDILKGAASALFNKKIAAINIELNLDQIKTVDKFLAKFEYYPDLRFNWLPNNSRYWRKNKNKKLINRIYCLKNHQAKFRVKIIYFIFYGFKRNNIVIKNYFIYKIFQIKRKLK